MSGTSDWDVKEIVERFLPKQAFSDVALPLIKRREITKADITDEMIENAYIFMAQIVEAYGEQYLPIFERLYHEIETRKKNKALLEKALAVSKSNKPQL